MATVSQAPVKALGRGFVSPKQEGFITSRNHGRLKGNGRSPLKPMVSIYFVVKSLSIEVNTYEGNSLSSRI